MKLVLEVLEGEKTIKEIASSYEVLSSMGSLIPLFKFSQ